MNRTLSWVLWVLQVITAGVTFWLTWFRSIEIPHCDLQCDFELLGSSIHVYTWIAGGLALVSALAIVLLRGRPRVWWIPVAGIGMTLVAFFVTGSVINKALLFS